MKKFITARSLVALVLLAAMLLSMLVACKDKDVDKNVNDESSNVGEDATTECTEHVDANNDTKCDNCDADVPYAGNVTGAILSNAIIEQMEKARSMKIDFSLEDVEDQDFWEVDYDENGEPLDPVNQQWYRENKTKLTAVVSKTAEGSVNAKIDIFEQYRYSKDAEFETNEFTALYFVDGVIYSYDDSLDAYIKTDTADVAALEELEAMLNELCGQISISEEEQAALIAAIGDTLITVFNIKDNKGSISFDAKPVVDYVLNYIKNIPMDTMTLAWLLNDIFSLVDNSINSQDLFYALRDASALTVNEALAAIDEALMESSGMTLQQLYDTAVNSDDFVNAISDALRKMADPSLSEEELEDYVTSTIEGLQSLKIDELVEAYELGDVVLYDLVMSFVAEKNPEMEIPSREQFFDSLEEILCMTLSEFEAMIGTPVFSTVKAAAEAFTLNALSGKLDISFKGILNIDTIEGEFIYDVVTREPAGVVADKFDVSKVMTKLTLKIYDISKDPADIALPSDITVYIDAFSSIFESIDPAFGELSISSNYDGSVWVTIDLPTATGGYSYISADNLDADILKTNTVTIANESIEIIHGWSDIFTHEDTKDLVIELDLANKTYTIIQCPEFALSE